MIINRILGVIGISLVLLSCAVQKPQHGTAINDIDAALEHSMMVNHRVQSDSEFHLPKGVNRALLPQVNIQLPESKAIETTRRFDVAVKAVPARTFFMSLVKDTPYNMVVSPKVQGTISVNLHHVTVEEVMAAVRDSYGFEFVKTPYGYRVSPPTLETKIFTVNYLDVYRKGRSQIQVSSGQITDKINGSGSSSNLTSSSLSNSQQNQLNSSVSGSTIETRSQMNFWQDLNKTLIALLGSKKGRSVVVNPQAGLVIVHAYPAEIREVAKYLDTLQGDMNREVILDAKILEVVLNDGYQAGLDWGSIVQGAKRSFDNVNLDSLEDATIFSLKWSAGSLNGLVNLIATQGNVQSLSSPRIATVNNQTAVIKVGQDEFFVTGVASNSQNSGGTTEFTQDIDLTPFFSGISLNVTPQISSDDSVVLHIHPTVSSVVDANKQFVVSGQTQDLPLALSTIRESDSIVRARNGEVVVIAGLMEHNSKENDASVPWLGDIPLIGNLMKRTDQSNRKTELVILLRPVVVKEGVWNHDLQNTNERMRKMNRGFHFGGKPKVFGTLGEVRG